MCRKLETEAEKVLPFYVSSLLPEEEDDVAAAMQEAPSEPLAEVTKYAVWTFICPIDQLLFKKKVRLVEWPIRRTNSNVNTGTLPQTRENVGDQVVMVFFLILRLIDWEGRASFFRPITEQSVAKPM